MALRQKVNKAKSAREFRKNVRKTKAANLDGSRGRVGEGPMRGGWRL